MLNTITIALPAELQQALEDVTRQEGITAEELIGDALKEYLFFRRFHLLREHMISKAQEQEIHTHPRAGWEEQFRRMAELGEDHLLDGEIPGLSSWDDEEWEWE